MKLWLNGTLILITSIHPKTKSQYDMHWFILTTQENNFLKHPWKKEDFLQNLLQKCLTLAQDASKDSLEFWTKISLKSYL